MAHTHDEARIREALELLNSVAADEGERLKAMITERYDYLKDFVTELESDAEKRIAHAYATGKKKVKEVATDVDKSVHTSPWMYIGGAAAVGLLVGLFLGRDRR